MSEYLVELYRARTQVQAAADDGERARAAAELLASSGTPVRLIRSIFVPEDETCFLLFAGPSADAVRAALTLARLPCTEVHPTAGRTDPHPSSKGSPMTQLQNPAVPDFRAIKDRQRQAWTSGDYAVVASRIVRVAEELCDSADLRAGWLVLDVATGTGNAAIAAARHGSIVAGVDYVPELLDVARRRAQSEGVDVALTEGDAEDLPYPDGAFDAVMSVFGSMFAPDHERAAAELLRVTRPGGTLALASWTPEGFIGQLFAAVGRHVPPPPGVASPLLWGTEPHLRKLFGDGIADLSVAERTFTWRFTSAAELVAFFRTWYGPALKAFATLDSAGQAALERDLVDLVTSFDRLSAPDAIAVPATYTETIATRR